MINNKNSQSGFTMTELMFAMVFVTFLLVFSVVVVIQITQIYNKGLTIRQINQSGRQLSEDLKRTMRYSDAAKFAAGGSAYNAATQRLCVNDVSYVWNLQGDTAKNKYSGGDTQAIKLVRVADKGGKLCTSNVDVPRSDSVDIIPSSVDVLCFNVSQRDGGKIGYIDAVISTSGSNSPRPVTTTSTNTTCLVNGTSRSWECAAGVDGAFCAISQFQNTIYLRK